MFKIIMKVNTSEETLNRANVRKYFLFPRWISGLSKSLLVTKCFVKRSVQFSGLTIPKHSYSEHASFVIPQKLTYTTCNWLLFLGYSCDNARRPDSIASNRRMLFSTVTLLVCRLLGQMDSKRRTIGGCVEVLPRT